MALKRGPRRLPSRRLPFQRDFGGNASGTRPFVAGELLERALTSARPAPPLTAGCEPFPAALVDVSGSGDAAPRWDRPRDPGSGMDYQLERWINGPAGHHPLLDSLMRAAANWAEALFIALVAGWFLLGWIRGRRAERQGALTALVAAGGALLVNQLIGHLWVRARPFVAHPHTVHLLVAPSGDPSFPSDHAAPAFAIAVVLFARHRRLGALALCAAALMSYARVYVGDHYPGDVAWGALVGLAVAAVVLTWLGPLMARMGALVDRLIRALRLPLPDNP